jgi:hypothetical protein
MQFEVDRSDYHHTRFADSAPADELPNGHVLLALESFAFTANNISYALAGDLLDYWGFFPAEAPWGRIPVMGIGRVTRSSHPDIAVGGRYFGFFPMADRHVVAASPSVEGFVDRGEHRTQHAPAYRSFNLATNDPAYDVAHEGRYLITRGLFVTSFLVDDFLGDHGLFGATTVLITSASSRTSIALAHCLRARGGARVVGLTSRRHVAFVESVGLYDSVLCYDDIETLDAGAPSVVVDMSGSVDVIGRVHRHFGEQLAYSCRVGATHWDAGGSTNDLPGPAPTFFFAPSQIKKRSQEWGRDVFDTRVAAALDSFLLHARNWMVIERSSGPDAVDHVYRATLAGETRPEVGHILSLSADTTSAVLAEDIPVAHTPIGGWTEMPAPILAVCTEPIVADAPDMRGTWRVTSVEVEGVDQPTHPAIGKVQRIEQAGDRVIVTASGIVHDMRCDGTEAHGVHDVAEFDRVTPITVVATFEHGVHVLRPVGLPIEVTRRIDGNELVWTYVGFTARLERIESR